MPDLIILGSGAAGMAAAVSAAMRGLRAVVVEATGHVGGTSALSAGSVWVPGAGLPGGGGSDDLADAALYLDAAVGNHAPQALRRAFLDAGPEMIAALQRVGALDLMPYPHHPDYLADLPGASLAGRALGARPFDGSRLGSHFDILRPPLPEFTILGGMLVDRTDIAHLMQSGRSLRSLLHSARIVLRHGRDRLTSPRGKRLVMGQALVGRLLKAALDLGVEIRTGTVADRIEMRDGRAMGVVTRDGTLTARRGIVVATGGFAHHPGLRDRHYPRPVATASAVPEGNRGGGIEMLLAAGARLAEGHANSAFWAPASVRRRKDGSRAVFPHFVLDRAKPGVVAVDAQGRRFVDESTSYQRFVEAMYATGTTACHLVCSAGFIRRYGLGVVRPMTRDLRRWVDEGYLIRGDSVDRLAAGIGADPATLAETFARNDRFAATGPDEDFGRGGNAYARNLGDPAHGPNPCLGPIGPGPYYALRIEPADIGTSLGVVTDAQARVLDASDRPIPGLYAAGADMASVMGGVYPGPGITLGPALTFGYIAARHAASMED